MPSLPGRCAWRAPAGRAYTDALKSCHTVGAAVEGSTRARDQAAQAAVAFLKKAFGL